MGGLLLKINKVFNKNYLPCKYVYLMNIKLHTFNQICLQNPDSHKIDKIKIGSKATPEELQVRALMANVIYQNFKNSL